MCCRPSSASISISARECSAARRGPEPLDPFDLGRFVDAQAPLYREALAELRRGHKQGHWMWFVFPQIAGLGSSAMARHYAIASAAEARSYLEHPVLGPRLRECTAAVLAHKDKGAEEVFGEIDTLKLRSSMTLFAAVAEPGSPFERCLLGFFGGAPDPATLRLLVEEGSAEV
ncbi:DUF1810 domain-containing protein [Sphingomonas sp.]|uniref:DUF1810 domain-containing protein n=1 Tax=Sphingomonas sp. TaxID=28214 RepID=UPI002FCC2189